MGASLLLAGLMVFAYGYLTNCVPYESHDNGSYTYADYVGLFGGIFIFLGLAVLLLFPFRKWFGRWAREHGAIES